MISHFSLSSSRLELVFTGVPKRVGMILDCGGVDGGISVVRPIAAAHTSVSDRSVDTERTRG